MSDYKTNFQDSINYARSLSDSQLIEYYRIEKDRAERYEGVEKGSANNSEEETAAVAAGAEAVMLERGLEDYL